MLIANAFDGYLPKAQIFQREQFVFSKSDGATGFFTVIVTARIKMFKLPVGGGTDPSHLRVR
jgi:hypothetical protein